MPIDHLVYVVPDLTGGMTDIEVLLGVRPVVGGRHPDFGTHNALLSIGPTTYLEIIAPDPGLAPPHDGWPFGITPGQGPGIATWALRTDKIRSLAGAAAVAGIELGPIRSGTREQSDGSLLSWQLTDPWAMPFDGAVPFLIDWGSAMHPAGSAPRAGELMSIQIEHPEAKEVREVLSMLGVDIIVVKADKYTLAATIKTKRGTIELK